jgi:hypothetical protein
VPLLSPEVAAAAGTAGELVLPVLLALGLGGRFAALGLSVVNAVAVASLPEIAPAALQQHILWGCLLVGVLLWGPGRWALDRFVRPWLQTWRSGSWLHSRRLRIPTCIDDHAPAPTRHAPIGPGRVKLDGRSRQPLLDRAASALLRAPLARAATNAGARGGRRRLRSR